MKETCAAPWRARPRELLATGLGGCRALVDVIVAAAARAGLPVAVEALQPMKPAGSASSSRRQNVWVLFMALTVRPQLVW